MKRYAFLLLFLAASAFSQPRTTSQWSAFGAGTLHLSVIDSLHSYGTFQADSSSRFLSGLFVANPYGYALFVGDTTKTHIGTGSVYIDDTLNAHIYEQDGIVRLFPTVIPAITELPSLSLGGVLSANGDSIYSQTAIGEASASIGNNTTVIGVGAFGGAPLKTTGHQQRTSVLGAYAQGNGGYDVVLGAQAHVGNSFIDSISVDSVIDYGTALGYNSLVMHNYSTAVGQNAKTTAQHQIMLGTSSDTVVASYLRLLHGSSGSAPTGAVIVDSLNTLATPHLTNKYLLLDSSLIVGTSGSWIINRALGSYVVGTSNFGKQNGITIDSGSTDWGSILGGYQNGYTVNDGSGGAGNLIWGYQNGMTSGGRGSVLLGSNNHMTAGEGSIVIGMGNIFQGAASSMVLGSFNAYGGANGNYDIIAGYRDTLGGYGSSLGNLVGGSYNLLSADSISGLQYNVVLGYKDTLLSADGNLASNNFMVGNDNKIVSAFSQFVCGYANQQNDSAIVIVGNGTNTGAGRHNAFTISVYGNAHSNSLTVDSTASILGLPTSAAGLTAGALYDSSGIVKVKH